MRSAAMSPTIKPGEKVTINYGAYAIDGPQRWDVVAFEPPFDTNSTFVFRVVGLPGETVSFDKAGIKLDGQELLMPERLSNITYVSIAQSAHPTAYSDIQYPYLIPKGHYFVLGDNSAKAKDSRFWGAVPRSNIVGRVNGK